MFRQNKKEVTVLSTKDEDSYFAIPYLLSGYLNHDIVIPAT